MQWVSAESVFYMAIGLMGIFWLFRPEPELLIPGALVFDEKTARSLGLDAVKRERIRAAGGFPALSNPMHSRLLGLMFFAVGSSALVDHFKPAFVLLELAIVFDGFVFVAARTNGETGTSSPSKVGRLSFAGLAFNDAALLIALSATVANIVILLAIGTVPARFIAIALFLTLLVLAHAHSELRTPPETFSLTTVAIDRRRRGFGFTLLLAAGVFALGFSTFVLGNDDVFSFPIRFCAIVGTFSATYYAHKGSLKFKRDLQQALQ